MTKKRTTHLPKFIAAFLLGVIGLTGVVFASQFSSMNMNNRSKAAVLSEAVARFSITSDTGIVNQDGSTFTTGQEKVWLGTGADVSQSYLGMHFSGANIPAGSIVKSASLEFTADGGWITMGVTFFGDTSGKGLFTRGTRPSTRTLTTKSSSYSDNENWEAGKTYTYDVTAPIKELVDSRGNSTLVLIAKGSGGQYGRKNVFGKPSTGKSPVLTVVYTSMLAGGSTPTAVPVSTSTPRPTATPTSMPGMTMTPMPIPTATPGSAGGGTSSASDSPEMTMWSSAGKNKPNPKYDKCDDGTDVVAAHQKFSVIGPDGKRYPTWHAPVVVNPITGVGKCYFGHEHGRNPVGYAFYDEVRKNFAYDANKNGTIDANELAIAGIPFGYINNAVDLYFATHSTSMMFMRHEDHVGHKIEYANGEGDTGTGAPTFNKNMTGGLIVPYKNGESNWTDSGISCYHFDKIHQGVSSADALSNNMHEIIIHEKCTSKRPGTPNSTTLLSGMMTFGAPGEFTEFCNDKRTTIVSVGKNAETMNLPGTRGDGTRNIITRACAERTILVPDGKFSSFPYEEWDGTLRVVKPNGTEVAANNGSWEVLDAIRYYNPNSPTMISYVSDLCYENKNGLKFRGNPCDAMTNYGTTTGITWDDRRSFFHGLSRGQYINYHRINNAGGSEVWYTDPFGRNASTTPFPGSIKQIVSPVSLTQFPSDPRIVQRENDSGSGTVHAPN